LQKEEEMDLLTLAKNVKRGAKLLDRRFPHWRQVMRKHATTFRLSDGDHCILGTLEHRVGRLKVLAARTAKPYDSGFNRASKALGLAGDGKTAQHGFDITPELSTEGVNNQYSQLEALWRAEFESL
jgi:hypothetical protein